MDVEDEVPDRPVEGVTQHPGVRRKKVWRWLTPVQLAGYAVAVVLFLAMAGATRTAVATRVAYDTAPVCTVGAATQCGPNDDTRETITVTGSTAIMGAGKEQDEEQALVLEFSDPSGSAAGDSATFSGDNIPPLDSTTGVGQQFAAELWHGGLMWLASVDAPDGDQYFPQQSVENTTRYTRIAPAVVGGIDFVCCCFGWWLAVRRGWVSDRGSVRPLYALAALIVTVSGWVMISRMEASGITVMGVGLAMSALLGLLLPRIRFSAGRPGRVRSSRAGRVKEPTRDGIFR